jgi:hypothetical protein
MQKWLNDLYAQILKNGFNPGGGGGGGGSHSGGSQGVLVGKYLGDTYTDQQKQAIASGSFNGLNIGDYWTINDINWRIADYDYYYNVGDTPFTKHHIIVVPDTTLYDAKMNKNDSTTSCYSGSEMRTTNLDNARTAFDNAFGSSFIPSHSAIYSTSSNSSGSPTEWSWINMRVELMSEEQLYGHSVWGSCNHNGYDVGTQKTQFRLFTLDKTKINIRESYWLTNSKSAQNFAIVTDNGIAHSIGASSSIGVRPFACIIGDPEQ